MDIKIDIKSIIGIALLEKSTPRVTWFDKNGVRL